VATKTKAVVFTPEPEIDTIALPETVKILHKVFDLRERDYKESFGNTRLAEIDFMHNDINYLPIQGSESVDSIIHEILHGIFGLMQIDQHYTHDQEEYIVSAMATGITTVMKDNPDLFDALQDMLE